MAPLRVIFIGTAELACPSLAALAKNPGYSIEAVVTQPDRPKGRDLKLAPPPVKLEAQRLHCALMQPERIRHPDSLQALQNVHPDLVVVAAYGQILPQALLDLPSHSCINVHASLLPRYRGAAPIQWAILDGCSETGVTIMKMDAGLDTGPMLAQRSTPITSEDNAVTVHDRLAQLGADLLLETLPGWIAGSVQPIPQPAEGQCYARKITKADGLINWSDSAIAIWNRVRALVPWPGAFTQFPSHEGAKLLKIWEATPEDSGTGEPGKVVRSSHDGIRVACGQGTLLLKTVQKEGSRRVAAWEFSSGAHIQPGIRLG